MEYLASCPICTETGLSSYISCKDYTVSKETFSLQRCDGCGFVLTNPRPEEADLARYYQSDAYISHSNSSKQFLDRVYRIARSFTLKWKFELIHRHAMTKPTSILDYGCGTGSFLHACKESGLHIAGVEPAQNARTSATELTGTDIAPEIQKIRGTFDVITLWHVLEHVVHLNETVKHLRNRLNQNGSLFIAVPNHRSADAQYYKEFWAGFDVPRHLWHFSRNTMETLLSKHDLRIENVLPMPLDAYYVSLLSQKYKVGRQTLGSMATAILRGKQSNNQAKKTGEYSSLIYIVRK